MNDSQDTKFYAESEDHNEGVYFSDSIVDRLHDSVKWARIISLAGFFFSFFIAAFAFAIPVIMPALSQMAARSGGAALPANAIGTFMTVYYLFIALLCFIFHLLLFQFTRNLQQSLDHNDQLSMEAAFTRLSAFFKYWGVLTIIIFGMVLLSIFGIVSGLAAA